MKKKLKVISFLLAVLFIFPICLTACGNDNDGDGEKGGRTPNPETVTTETVDAAIINATSKKLDSTSKALFETDYRPSSEYGSTIDNLSIYRYLAYCAQPNLIIHALDYLTRNQITENGQTCIEYDKVYKNGNYFYKIEKKTNGIKAYFDAFDSENEKPLYYQYLAVDYVNGVVKKISSSIYDGSQVALQSVLDYANNKFYLLGVDNQSYSIGEVPTADRFNSGNLTLTELASKSNYLMATGNITDDLENLNFNGYFFYHNSDEIYSETYGTIYNATYTSCPMRNKKLVATNTANDVLIQKALEYAISKAGMVLTVVNEKKYYSYTFIEYNDLTSMLGIVKQTFDASDGTTFEASATSKALLTAITGYVNSKNATNYLGIDMIGDTTNYSTPFKSRIALKIDSDATKYNQLIVSENSTDSNAKYFAVTYSVGDYSIKTIEEFDGSTTKTIFSK